ncbi:MAG: helix-turn-helix domain-containing protein, partial [Prevotella sp.]
MKERISISDFNRQYADVVGNLIYADDSMTMIYDVRHLPFWNEIGDFDFAVVILCKEGCIEASLNDTACRATAGDLVFCSGLHAMTKAMLSTDFLCDVICLSTRKYHELMTPDREVMNNLLFAIDKPVLRLSEEETELVKCYQKLVWTKMKETATCFSKRTISAIIHALILEFMAICERLKGNGTAEGTTECSGRSTLAHNFLMLLAEDVSQRHTVAYYAGRLCVSAKYLSTVVKRETGKTVSEWIHEQLTEQIRNMLINTSLSCKEMAAKTGFGFSG